MRRPDTARDLNRERAPGPAPTWQRVVLELVPNADHNGLRGSSVSIP